jgi:hypothetical protein
MNISANSIFHFTPTEEYLISILKNGFLPRYCLENNFVMIDDCRRWAIPMVCFCDIPLSNIKDHVSKYGYYGLGMTKEWGIKKGLSPILYTTENSQLTKSLIYQRKIIIENIEKKANIFEIYDRTLYTSFFIKEYEGFQNKNNKYKEPIRFYDEREWRYVPSILEFKENTHIPMISNEIYEDKSKLEKYNKKLSKTCSLKFELSDIKYILLPKEKQISTFLEKFDLKIISNKIMSLEQILSDF